MKWNHRNIHRDIAYFYIGLIIAFSFSGIILNHRQDWYPMDYAYESEEVQIALPDNPKSLDSEEFIKSIAQKWDLQDKYDGHRIRGEELRANFKRNITLDINTKTGKGFLEYKRKVPVLGHTMFLHKSTNSFWIWYSDIFGAAMLIIAFTGLFITKGKNSFRKRGWKLALAGVLFPILFLILFA
ncbi:PepSY-associated TM helix domain-containing protein [Flagellimonas meridianipacifica]|uniref:PepSY-associated transmembrane protein n=1 Tax=Flagellimonas meridianipacifica TaxID=1080225 RepID=A0A2T0MD95_9FLAO|nr:PepSY-associated TM helix domain-containing protein [Allomuricauda pacifica]PRX55469.1 hypothetical protein CLV81_3882 [Allomuricauda pacifica]